MQTTEKLSGENSKHAPAPLQEAVAQGIVHFDPSFYEGLNAKYQGKRDRFVRGLQEIGMDPLIPSGAYYLVSRYDRLAPDTLSADFVTRMIATAGVGAVPSSDFVRDTSKAPWIRFCLAVEDDVLVDALNRLGQLVP